jgi:Ca2+-binding RTX toxin-like protein
LTDGTSLKNFEHYTVSFGKGNDVVKSVGAAQSVSFYGYDGNDTLIGTNGSDELDGGNGNDTLTSGAGSDRIADNGGTNVIKSGDGSDIIHVGDAYSGGAAGHNTVDMGTGDDSFYRTASTGKLSLDGGTGTDFASIDFSKYTAGITFKLAASVTATNAPVTVKNVERVALAGGSGNDVFTGGSLNDDLRGGGGNDVLTGGAGNDTIDGGLGNDTLKGGTGNDTIYGDGQTLTGGRDSIYAEDGNDLVYMGISDRANGGTGTDRVVLNVSEQTKDIAFTFSTGTVNVDAATSFIAFEALDYIGSKGKDTVTGGSLDDKLDGRTGNDILKGGSGNDALEDGAGSDQLFGDAGNDWLTRTDAVGKDVFDGGSGTDTLSFREGATSVVLDLTTQSKNKGLALGLTVKNVEIIEGSVNDDDIRGDANANTFYGNGSDDVLDGRDGNDTLVGGAGDDWLTGGKGNDRFVFDVDGRDGEGDIITDFTRGQDKLVIDKSDYQIAVGDTAVTLVAGANPVATSTKGSFLFESDNGRLWFDADGKGTEADLELVAILQNVKTLSTSDFAFI